MLTHAGAIWTFILGTSKTVWVKSRIPNFIWRLQVLEYARAKSERNMLFTPA